MFKGYGNHGAVKFRTCILAHFGYHGNPREHFKINSLIKSL